jgi:hypothetical protein
MMKDTWIIGFCFVFHLALSVAPVLIGAGGVGPEKAALSLTGGMLLSLALLALMVASSAIWLEINELFFQGPAAIPENVEGTVRAIGLSVPAPHGPGENASAPCVMSVPLRPYGGLSYFPSIAVPFALHVADKVLLIDPDPAICGHLLVERSIRPSRGMQWLRPLLGLPSLAKVPWAERRRLYVRDGDTLVIWGRLRTKSSAPSAPGMIAAELADESPWVAFRRQHSTLEWYEIVSPVTDREVTRYTAIGVGTLAEQLVDSAFRLRMTWWMLRWWIPACLLASHEAITVFIQSAWNTSPAMSLLGAVLALLLLGVIARTVLRRMPIVISGVRAAAAVRRPFEPLPPLSADAQQRLVGAGSANHPSPEARPMHQVLFSFLVSHRGRRVLASTLFLIAVLWLTAWAAGTYGFVAVVIVVGVLSLLIFLRLALAPQAANTDYPPTSGTQSSHEQHTSASPHAGSGWTEDRAHLQEPPRPREPPTP